MSAVCAVSFWARVRTEAQRYTHRHDLHTNRTGTNTICGGWRWPSSYLQSQRFPSHVLEQSRGGGERALWAFLQRQGNARGVPTQQIHQVLQLPAHLVNNNSVMKVSTIHRHPRDSDHRNNKQIFQYEQTVSDWFRDSTFIPFTHDLDYFSFMPNPLCAEVCQIGVFIQGAVVVVILIQLVDPDGCKLQPVRFMLMRMVNAKTAARGHLVHLLLCQSAGAVMMW